MDTHGFEEWSAAPRVLAGHLRSSSEKMLDDLVESPADTLRKPSFARIQSVQVVNMPSTSFHKEHNLIAQLNSIAFRCRLASPLLSTEMMTRAELKCLL